MKLTLQPLHPNFQVPIFATDGAAGFDLYAVEDGQALVGLVTKVPLGFAAAVPEGHAMLISARSGHGAKHGAGVPHGYGLIDSDYRGELFMLFVTNSMFSWKAGDRIAQAIIVPVPRVEFALADTLPETKRGTGGFGSTGAK